MNPALILPIINGIISVVQENVEDKDKKNELVAQLQQSQIQLIELFVKTTTTPKVDAFVKLCYVFTYSLLPLLRPLGAAVMTAVGLYMHLKGIQLDQTTNLLLDSAFPGWMVSRHVNKQTEAKELAKLPDIKKDPFKGLPGIGNLPE